MAKIQLVITNISTMIKKLLLAFMFLAFQFYSAQPLCDPPVNIVITTIGANTATVSWTNLEPISSLWEIYIAPAGSPAPANFSMPMFQSNSMSFTITGLQCSMAYNVYIRNACGSIGVTGAWSSAVTFSTMDCSGTIRVPNLNVCPENGLACFDLTQNEPAIVNGLTPGSYNLTYFESFQDAANSNFGNRIVTPVNYCITSGNQPIYVLLEYSNGDPSTIYLFSAIRNLQSCAGLILDAFFDANNNGLHDSGEITFPLGQYRYEINNDGNIHNVTATSNIYYLYDSNISNSYDLQFIIDPDYASLYQTGIPQIQNVNPSVGMVAYGFPITAAQPLHDVSVTLSPLSLPRPGFSQYYAILYSNLGNQTITSGTITFTKDDALSFYTLPDLAVATPTGFSYQFTNLAPFEKRVLYVHTTLGLIPDVNLGQLINNTVAIAPIDGETQLTDNTATITEAVVGSYDPNDIMEAHGEKIIATEFAANDYLTYTIRFENTGTANAENVRITDVLDDQLDATSVKMLSASNNYTLDRVNNSLTWRFANIQLSPAEANPEAAQGYVTFKVKPKSGFTTGTVIPNTAEIFFDFNPAIVTNTFETRFVDMLNITTVGNNIFEIYPNPATDKITASVSSGSIQNIVVYDILGKKIIEEKVKAKTVHLNFSAISGGLYLIEITSATGQKSIKKLLVK